MFDIFVIAPYTHEDQDVVSYRVEQIEKYVVKLLNEGKSVFSAVAMLNHLIDKYGIDKDYEFWEYYCKTMIKSSKEIHVLKLEDWETSVGVADELCTALELDKIIKYIAP